MATYNWAFRPNVTNKYGFNIQDTADDVKPNNACYVALFGNDLTGNGSRMYPYRSIQKVQNYSGLIIFGSGVWRDFSGLSDTLSTGTIVADGDVVFDFFNNPGFTTYIQGNYGVSIKNLTKWETGGTYTFKDAYFENIENFGGQWGITENTIFKNIGYIQYNVVASTGMRNCTVINCNRFQLTGQYLNKSLIDRLRNNIFVNTLFELSYSKFYEYNNIFRYCSFQSQGVTLVPNTIQELREFNDTLSAHNPQYNFNGCLLDDPKFNNPDIGDYSLAFDSPAKNMSYLGTFIGAVSIGHPIAARSDESTGGFDLSTKVNITVADNSLVLTDPSIDASIESKVISNITGRELAKAPIFGFNADRNGQYIDSIADLATTTVSAGSNLKSNTPYLVAIASITYNGSVIQAGERFTTTSVLSFASDGGGTCREIIEAPQRHTIMARFSNGGAIKNVGESLTSGYWYYVNGTITYNGETYSNQLFKSINTNSFIGAGVVTEAMTNQVFQHYEPGIKFTSNNVGNVRTGEIVKGNGDPEYLRGSGFEFPISARFMQLKYIIRVNNLKP